MEAVQVYFPRLEPAGGVWRSYLGLWFMGQSETIRITDSISVLTSSTFEDLPRNHFSNRRIISLSSSKHFHHGMAAAEHVAEVDVFHGLNPGCPLAAKVENFHAVLSPLCFA
ncbi:hypothetical protein LCGC14_2751530 [marine sediment metagenome]|uniref:Uncharacterized protein n=1 Tax=marine sediment metagenome TaxID=412755 RepID=A0A0F9BA78_9ZZZZ